MSKVSWDPSIDITVSVSDEPDTSHTFVPNSIDKSHSGPSLCLNMIVKNESRIITRLLQSVVGIIDSYCICDTGSTDNTVEIIQSFFNRAGISGKIVREPFRDFGYNRTFALNACIDVPNADFVLLLDADMIFQLNPDISPNVFKKMLKDDAYCIFQGSDKFYYKNTRIVKNRKNITYWGVTHEYVSIPHGCVQSTFTKSITFINDIGDGGSKSDKFVRDIELLKNGLRENPNNDRYTFYLANTYHDAGFLDLAIEMYKKRVEIGGWYEEIWYSYYRIGKCYAKTGDMTKAIEAWMNAYDVFPNRVENLLEIITYYRLSGKNKLAYAFYLLADKSRNTYPARDYLFMEKDAYEYQLDFELSILGYYTNPEKYNIPKCCMTLVSHPNIDEPSIKNVISNYKFYTQALCDMSLDSSVLDLSPLYSIGTTLSDELHGLYPSTPSLCLDKTGKILTVVKRYVNYTIDEHGGYVNQKHITTKNVISTFQLLSCDDKPSSDNSRTSTLDIGKDVLLNIAAQKLEPHPDSYEFILNYNTVLDNVYVGLEDMRLYENNDTIYYSCNRGVHSHIMRIEHGIVSKESRSVENSVLLQKPGLSDIEKNWVMIEKKDDEMYFIYKWSPLVVGKIVPSCATEEIPCLFNTIYEYSTPRVFSHLRGSTNGVRINNEIWFLCHTVSYEDRRYYYQMFVVLDADTYLPKYYTPWITFEKKKVEYSLGFIYLEASDALLIGYSLMDCETKYMTVRMSAITEMFITV